jgi:hypothetical protein
MTVKTVDKNAARFLAYADLLRDEARQVDNEHDRHRLLEQAEAFQQEANRITGGTK